MNFGFEQLWAGSLKEKLQPTDYNPSALGRLVSSAQNCSTPD